MNFKINMEPLTACGGSFSVCDFDKIRPHTATPFFRGDKKVEDEGMTSAVPGHVDKADEPSFAPGTDPSEAVLAELLRPVMVSHRMTESFGVQCLSLRAVEGASPLVFKIHLK